MNLLYNYGSKIGDKIMDNSKKIKVYISLLITVIILIGISYAYYRINKKQSADNSISIKNCLDATLTEETAEIILSNAYPLDDFEGLDEAPFTFSITNNCDSYTNVQITLFSEYRESTNSTYLKDNFVKVNLSLKNQINKDKNNLLTSYKLEEVETNKESYVLLNTGLDGNETKTFDLRLWIDANTTIEDGLSKTWKGKVIVTFTAAKEPIQLLTKILGENNSNVSEPITTPGTQISADSEKILASTEDDYGTSYYFRGAVDNNFVEYANMCWRIVRVTGNGAIKLVLYNYNGLTDTNDIPASETPCSGTGGDYGIARYRETGTTSSFSENYNSNQYVGLLYGTSGSYSSAHKPLYTNIILTNLNRWYTHVLSKQDNFDDTKLADTIWCNDKSVITDTTYNPWNYNIGTNFGFNANLNYYSATNRIVSSDNTAGGTGPSLICPNDNLDGKFSKFTVSETEYGNGYLTGYNKIGLLTTDEIVFAGGSYNTANSTYYLNQNATSNFWWTPSPASFGGVAFTWYVGTKGEMYYYAVTYKGGIRPVISLVSDIKITSGDGTVTNPYKIAS